MNKKKKARKVTNNDNTAIAPLTGVCCEKCAGVQKTLMPID